MGFTLVEMMVAIAVFSVVMVTAMSALISVIDANNKAKSLKDAINNISFALEGISKDMRMGIDYKCSDPVTGSSIDREGNCIGGGQGISFISSKTGNPYVFYKFNGSQLWSCLGPNVSDCSSLSDYSPLTSSEVILDKVVFYVLNVGDANKQPRMIMTVSGTAGPTGKPKLQTSFDLQTGVSQITRPE